MELFKQRDFGELIGAPFIFFGKEFKTLITGLLFFIGPFILLEYILINQFHFQSTESLSVQLQNIGNSRFSETLFITVLLSFFQNVMLYTFIGAYIKTLSELGSGNVEISRVWNEMKRFYWPYAGGLLLGSIMIVIGFILIIFPGIYLAVALFPLFAIIMFEEKGVTQSIGRSFDLIKGNWWIALGLILILGIILVSIVAVLTLFFNYLYGIIVSGTSLFVLKNLTGSVLDVFSSVFFISTPFFLYGHLIAEKENPDLVNRISGISGAEDIRDSEEKASEGENENPEDNALNNDDPDRFKPKY